MNLPEPVNMPGKVASRRTTTSRKGSTVTFNNWKRLSNAPIDLSNASAVHWRDFIVVMDFNSNVMLYHPKWNMWSTLPDLPEKPARGCPLVVYNDKLLILARNGKIYEFLSDGGRWAVNKSLDPNIDTDEVIQAAFTCHGDTMFLIYGIGNVQPQTTQFRFVQGGHGGVTRRKTPQSSQATVLPPSATESCYVDIKHTYVQLFNGASHSWCNRTKIQTNVLKSDLPFHVSISATASDTVYVSNGHDTYSLLAEPQHCYKEQTATDDTHPGDALSPTCSAESVTVAEYRGQFSFTVTQIASPPHQMYALCVVRHCLFAFGGKDCDNQPFSTVYQYDPEAVHDVWKPAGNMCSSRYGVATTIFKRGDNGLLDVFVIGGYLGQSETFKLGCRITESCEVST